MKQKMTAGLLTGALLLVAVMAMGPSVAAAEDSEMAPHRCVEDGNGEYTCTGLDEDDCIAQWHGTNTDDSVDEDSGEYYHERTCIF